jgi:hypothetical protein
MKHLRLVSLLAVWILFASSAFAAPPPPPTHTGATIARPTQLRPVQGKADCAAVLSLAAFVCDAAVKAGNLQLIWDESDKAVTGYRVYRVDGGGHILLGTATGTARYYLVKKRTEGYANLCFAVQASVGKQTSADSPHYCYRPGATATTRSFKPSRTVTQVAWTSTPGLNCGGPSLPASAFFQAANKQHGSAFTAFFPWLTHEQSNSGQIGVNGVYAGAEVALMRTKINEPAAPFGGYFCYAGPKQGVNATVNALAGVAFDLGELSKHKLYSATLTLKSSQILVLRSNKATLSNSGWCATFVAAANREWRIAPLGNLTYSKSGLVAVDSRPTAPIDVTSIVSAWASARYAADYGFIVGNPLPPGPKPPASQACLTKFASPSLQVVYF